jgi:Holliday junction resolvasome RuvABC endonuclease subunit
MRVLGIDPGAERLGWAIIEAGDEPKEVDVGISGLEREDNGSKEPYHEYRLRLLGYWIEEAPRLFDEYRPDELVNEIVPVVGGGNFVAATQSQLATAALTVIQIEALSRGIPIHQVGATTVKKNIGGSGKASKVKVRNGVYSLLPSTLRFKKEWVKVHDSSDACAIALCKMGYKV